MSESDLELHTVNHSIVSYPEIRKVLYGKNYKIPSINFDLWARDDMIHARTIIDLLLDYMSSPIILDNFSLDHNSRKEFLNRLQNENKVLFTFYSSNALRLKRIGSLVNVRLLEKGYLGNKARLNDNLNSILNLIPKNNNSFDHLSLDSKIDLVEEIRKCIFNLLVLFSQDKILH